MRAMGSEAVVHVGFPVVTEQVKASLIHDQMLDRDALVA